MSLIIGGAVLAIAIPGLLWLRFGKKGRKIFGNKLNGEDIAKIIVRKQNNIREIQKKIKSNNKILKDEVEIFYITKLKDENKLHLKDIDRLKREIHNLENSK